MARAIAHEIKNPLTPIQLSTEHLRAPPARPRPPPRRPRSRACLETVAKQVRALREIASEFSAYAKLPDLAPRPTDPAEFLREVVGALPRRPPAGRRPSRRTTWRRRAVGRGRQGPGARGGQPDRERPAGHAAWGTAARSACAARTRRGGAVGVGHRPRARRRSARAACSRPTSPPSLRAPAWASPSCGAPWRRTAACRGRERSRPRHHVHDPPSRDLHVWYTPRRCRSEPPGMPTASASPASPTAAAAAPVTTTTPTST